MKTVLILLNPISNNDDISIHSVARIKQRLLLMAIYVSFYSCHMILICCEVSK